MTAATGKFITVEGIEGVGKSTQVALLSAWLDERGVDHIVTREPGGTRLAEQIRRLALDLQSESLPPAAELLLMFAARSVHLANRIEPALAQGTLVICDRFTDATFAYQGAGRGVSTALIAALETLVQGTRQPDLTLLLDMPVADGLKRVEGRGARPDRFEIEQAGFFERVRAGYLQRAQSFPRRFLLIDASQTVATVQSQVISAIQSRLGAHGTLDS